MAIAIGGAGGGSGLGPAQRGPAAPQGAGQSREPWAMSPCLLGVPRSLGTGDRAPRQQQGKCSHSAPRPCSSHCDTERENPITWNEPQLQCPLLQHP